MKPLMSYLSTVKPVQQLYETLEKESQRLVLNNVNDNLAALLIATFYKQKNENALIIAPNLYKAQKIYDKMVQVLDEEHVYFFPMDEFISAEMLASSDAFRQERINTLMHIIKDKKGVVVTHTLGAIRKLPKRTVYNETILHITPGTIIEREQLVRQAIEMGYHRVDVVTNRGEIAVRGGIVDFYPYTNESPYRIEFFDDEIDSIRLFNPEDQRTINKIDEAHLTPIYELVYNDTVKEQAIARLTEQFEKKIQKRNQLARQELQAIFSEEIENIKEHNQLVKLHKYIDYFYDETETIVDYMDQPHLFYFDYQAIKNSFDQFEMEYHQFTTDWLEANKTVFVTEHYQSLNQIIDSQQHHIFIQEYANVVPNFPINQLIDFNSRSVEQYFGKVEDLYQEMKRYTGIKTYCISLSSRSNALHLSEELNEAGIRHALIGEHDSIIPQIVNILKTDMDEGFELINEQIKVITPYELYQTSHKKVKYRSTKMKDTTKVKDVDELKIGDYVVHVDHGFGQYLGIETLNTNGVSKDFLQIAYQGGDKLYVPVENVQLVQKYIGNEGVVPKLHKLGGTQWKKTKLKVNKKIQDIAAKLIKLYAEREQSIGYAFSPDTSLQKEFEAAFEYVETPDQLQAIREVKEDMERPVPMDRLLCGDVGYGKTEVAMRAAFKAVMDGKQVAYLAPTTILTQQHYQTFLNRFRDYPINIALLNRFVSPKQQKEIIEKIKKGQIDIVIGTHRILSKDVKFHDLGLLIVDEEQRFGVTHKERIKEYKVNIDVLTLTATPIPRTLQMSLIGVRSLSLLETPPSNRYPVQTYVLEENDTIMKEAIERELARGGQVFYLYNRVDSIDIKARKIMELVPDARVTYAHGQMTKAELEKTMMEFLNKEYDVLVCTTIIETGIDIANANTLIISNADRLGLSQLYQLRGRVGRSDRIAYAYMTYPKHKVISEVATKRLMAIKEFTELGSGFKIAKQDLAIRGAGDLLGSQQYGFIDNVGFELYMAMLKDAIDENKTDQETKQKYLPDESNIDIRILQDAYIPSSYIDNESLKIEIYKKIKLINSYDDLIRLENELIDRFSNYPEPVQNLLNLAYIKSASLDLGIEKIRETKRNVEFIFSKESSKNINGEALFMAASNLSRNINFKYIKRQLTIDVEKPRLKENYLELMKKYFVKITQSRNMSENE